MMKYALNYCLVAAIVILTAGSPFPTPAFAQQKSGTKEKTEKQKSAEAGKEETWNCGPCAAQKIRAPRGIYTAGFANSWLPTSADFGMGNICRDSGWHWNRQSWK